VACRADSCVCQRTIHRALSISAHTKIWNKECGYSLFHILCLWNKEYGTKNKEQRIWNKNKEYGTKEIIYDGRKSKHVNPIL